MPASLPRSPALHAFSWSACRFAYVNILPHTVHESTFLALLCRPLGITLPSNKDRVRVSAPPSPSLLGSLPEGEFKEPRKEAGALSRRFFGDVNKAFRFFFLPRAFPLAVAAVPPEFSNAGCTAVLLPSPWHGSAGVPPRSSAPRPKPESVGIRPSSLPFEDNTVAGNISLGRAHRPPPHPDIPPSDHCPLACSGLVAPDDHMPHVPLSRTSSDVATDRLDMTLLARAHATSCLANFDPAADCDRFAGLEGLEDELAARCPPRPRPRPPPRPRRLCCGKYSACDSRAAWL